MENIYPTLLLSVSLVGKNGCTNGNLFLCHHPPHLSSLRRRPPLLWIHRGPECIATFVGMTILSMVGKNKTPQSRGITRMLCFYYGRYKAFINAELEDSFNFKALPQYPEQPIRQVLSCGVP